MSVKKGENESENLISLVEQVKNAFLESEREIEEKILKIKKNMLNQTVASILHAERQNDRMIREIIKSIPQNNELTKNTVDATRVLNRLSSNLASQVK